MSTIVFRWAFAALAGLAAFAAQAQHGQPAGKPDAAATPVVKVNGKSVSPAEFEAVVRQAMRQKFYHGKVPEAQVIELQREIANNIVNNNLLLAEAKRRGIKPNQEKIQQTVRGYDERYGSSANWKENREKMLGNVVPELEQRDLLDQLERTVREVPAPKEAEVRAFYESRKDLFTEPEKLRLSVILLSVDPSAGKVAWDKAMEEGKAIYARLKGGANFAELARIHSGDKSAEQGGDMGYLHQGMLPQAIQAKVDGFKVGEVQEPMTTLHGIAIFRVDERVAPKLRQYPEVKERAADLLRRERGDEAWKKLVAQLRAKAKFSIDEAQFTVLAARLQ